MKTFIPLLLFLSTTASAWSIAFHDDKKCDSSNYVIHRGDGKHKGDCLELGVGGANNECFAWSDGTRKECNDPTRAPFTPKSLEVDDRSSCFVFYHKDKGKGGPGTETACHEIKGSESERWSISDECTTGTLRALAEDDNPDDYQRYFQCQDLILDP